MGFKKKLCLVKEKTQTRNKHTLWCFVYSLLFSTLFHHSYPPLNVTKVVKCFLMFFGDFFFLKYIICLFVCFSLKRMNMSFAYSRCIIRVLHLQISNSWISPCATKSSNMHDMENFHFLDIL